MVIPSNTKSACYTYELPEKPRLFSWSLEKEYYHIECRLAAWHKRALPSELENIRNLYRRFAGLYLKYIQTQTLTEDELSELARGIEHKSQTVWVKNYGYVMELAFYLPYLKNVICHLCKHKQAIQRERGLMMVGGAFTTEEKIALFTSALSDKSALVRARAVHRIWHYRLKELVPLLESRKQTESDLKVLEAIKFARFYIDKPPGNSVTFTPEDRAAYKEFD